MNSKKVGDINKRKKKDIQTQNSKIKFILPKKKSKINTKKSVAFAKDSTKNNLYASKSEKNSFKKNTKFEINQFLRNPINIFFNKKTNSMSEKYITKTETKKAISTYNNLEKENFKEKYDDFELNELEYKDAVKHDKRSFIKIYCSLLKREHKIIFTFFIYHDYNLFYIKIWRFIFLIISDMAMNALFFTDETMHKLYLTYGKYDFIQQIPQIVYSTIISQLIEVFICFLSMTDKPLYQIKKLKMSEENFIRIENIYKSTNIKLIIFFIFTFIFFGIFWYIIVIFCVPFFYNQPGRQQYADRDEGDTSLPLSDLLGYRQ